MIPIAQTDSRDLLGVVLLVVLVGAMGLFIYLTMAINRRRRAAVPAGLRPGPTDEDLERRVQIRYRVWGAVLVIFLAMFLPVYWFREPTRLEAKEEQFLDRSIERGADLYGPAGSSLVAVGCASCHGNQAEGGVRTVTTADGRTLTYAEPPLAFAFARYKAAGRNEEEIKLILRDAIERGRPGTPMPTWGLAHGGPLHAQQIDDLMNFLVAIQTEPPQATTREGEELFAQNCAICHGARGEGGVGPNLTVAFDRNTEQQIFETIKGGRVNYNRPSMPAWAHLGDDAIQALVSFLQSIQRG